MQNKGKFRFKCKTETKSSETDAILLESSTLDAKQFPKQMQNTNATNWFSESYIELYISYMIYISFL